jgi:hypothetical protein
LVIVSKDADFSNRIITSAPPPWVAHLRFGKLPTRRGLLRKRSAEGAAEELEGGRHTIAGWRRLSLTGWRTHEKAPHAVALGRRGAGKPKRFSHEERERRR